MLNCVSSTTLQSQPCCSGSSPAAREEVSLWNPQKTSKAWPELLDTTPCKVNTDLQPMQDGEGEGQGCSPY